MIVKRATSMEKVNLPRLAKVHDFLVSSYSIFWRAVWKRQSEIKPLFVQKFFPFSGKCSLLFIEAIGNSKLENSISATIFSHEFLAKCLALNNNFFMFTNL